MLRVTSDGSDDGGKKEGDNRLLKSRLSISYSKYHFLLLSSSDDGDLTRYFVK